MSEKKSYFEGKNILAVDDEKDILEIIEEELEMANVDMALDYQTASEKIRQNKYDLAILDIMGVDGLTLLEQDRGKKDSICYAHRPCHELRSAHGLCPQRIDILSAKRKIGGVCQAFRYAAICL